MSYGSDAMSYLSPLLSYLYPESPWAIGKGTELGMLIRHFGEVLVHYFLFFSAEAMDKAVQQHRVLPVVYDSLVCVVPTICVNVELAKSPEEHSCARKRLFKSVFSAYRKRQGREKTTLKNNIRNDNIAFKYSQ